jgi:cell division transport system ATP-binding protein
VVRLEHIGKRFAGGPPVLADLSLELEAGGFYVVVGGAGAGKTTLVNIIGLAEPPSDGRLIVFDRDPWRLDRGDRAALRRRIGLVFQDLRLIGRLSVRDNVALPLRLAGAEPRRIETDVGELLAWMGLAACATRPAAALSGSERRLVALGRAIVGRPQLLLADEPTADLDPDAIPLLMRVLAQVNRLGTTVLIATSGALAVEMPHRRYHLIDGRLATVGAAVAQ